MKPTISLQATLAAALLAVALAGGAATGKTGSPAEQRIQAGETASQATGGLAPADATVAGGFSSARRPSEWMMLLAGIAIAGWIASRRSGALQE